MWLASTRSPTAAASAAPCAAAPCGDANVANPASATIIGLSIIPASPDKCLTMHHYLVFEHSPLLSPPPALFCRNRGSLSQLLPAWTGGGRQGKRNVGPTLRPFFQSGFVDDRGRIAGRHLAGADRHQQGEGAHRGGHRAHRREPRGDLSLHHAGQH